MDAPTGPRPSRELSPRQREVAALIAAGKTNGEIASELGISLQGAKYHVSELLRALDLDTREEVAEWWRQQRGMRARFAVTARWTRMPALLKWGLGGAAAAGVAVVAVLALGLAAGSDDGDQELSPGVWVVVPEPSEADPSVTEVRLKSAGEDQFVAEVVGPASPALSPDGTSVAVVGGDESVRVVTISGDTVWHEADAGARSFVAPGWSPDSELFAFGTTDGVSIASSDDGIEATFDEGWNPPGQVGPWSPDSLHLLVTMPAAAGGGIAVVTRDGEVHSAAESTVWTDGFARLLDLQDVETRAVNSTHIVATRWLDEQRFEAWFVHPNLDLPSGNTGYVATGTLGAPGELSWEFSMDDSGWLFDAAIRVLPLQPRWLVESGEYPGAMNLGRPKVANDGTVAALIRYREDGEPPVERDSPDIKVAIVAMFDGEIREIPVNPDPTWFENDGAVAWDIVVIR